MGEFDLIAALLDELGDQTLGGEVVVGPGDDCTVINVTSDCQLVSSIDSLVPGVHYPPNAPPEYVGFRALGVCVSDLAAMGATPSYALVALTINDRDELWLRRFALGIRNSARMCRIRVAGGNMVRGAENISISVHGFVPVGSSLLRSGARAGDMVYVTGELGGAALALEKGPEWESPYYQVIPQIEAGKKLRGIATSAIDVSDGLVADVGHIAKASCVSIDLHVGKIPVAAGASVKQALYGGDDYQLCFTAPLDVGSLPIAATQIGLVTNGEKVYLDGKTPDGMGYEHFNN